MAAPGKLSVECSGGTELSFLATNHCTFVSPTVSSHPATLSSQGSRLHVGSSQPVNIDSRHFGQVENSDPTNSLPPVVIKVVVNGDDVETVNVGRDREDVAIKLQVCDPSRGTSDPDDASIFKSISKISMLTAIKLIIVLQIVAMLKGNGVNIHYNNVYNYHQTPPLPANKMEPVLVNSTGNDNYRPPVNQMEPALVNITGDGNYRSDEAVSEGSMCSKSTPLRRPDKKIASKKCMIQGKQIMPKPGVKDYLSLLFSAEPPQCSFQSNRIYHEMTSRLGDARKQHQILQSDHEDHCFWVSSRTQASVRFAMSRLEYSCPDDQEEIDVKQMQKEQKRSAMTKDFTALAMQGDSSSKQEAKSVAGAGHDNLTQGLDNMECLISPLLQVLAITVSLFIATFVFAKTLLQPLFAVTKRLNWFLDKVKLYVCSGRALISSTCIKLCCHVVAVLLPNHVPSYVAMLLLVFMECSGSAHGESPDSFDSGAQVTSEQGRQRQGEDVTHAGFLSESLSVPKNIQNVSTSDDDAPQNTDPDESYVENQRDDTDQIKRSDDPSDKTEDDNSSLGLNEVNTVQDFVRDIIGESDCQPSIAPDALELARNGFKNTGVEDPPACPEVHCDEVKKRIPSLPEDASIIYSRKRPGKPRIPRSVGRSISDDLVETDAADNETAEHVLSHLKTQPGCLTTFLDLVKRQERDFEQPILPNDAGRDERLHMPPKRKYIWPHWHCIHGEKYDMMNFILGIESALDGTGVFIEVSPLHVQNGGIQSWMVKPLSDSRTAYFDHMGEAPYIEEKVEIETFLQIRRKYEIYISHQDDDANRLKIYGLKKSVEDDRHFVKIFYQCREAVGYINVFLTFQTWSRRRFNQVHRIPSGLTLKAVMAHPAIHNSVSQLKQVYTWLQDGCYVRLTLGGRHVYPSPSWRVNHNCIMEIVPSIKGGHQHRTSLKDV
ncbi:uncharacterized protein LOC124254574 [Haliotis rubra]|uniref:uncharacterized protein LOC124254574 n=1 Tax=Haliotis rubra TaxID=36100 RepID=UPI001EE5C585|nr:uncharacterized protein LOC124254574 [Haliotis rubra]XP_046544460.1 uncharacterized protein LOC124254574 [Haliotis rubra]XP_046544527.1 uncharacterized protein LOC124254574 [Haliotis rubra]